MASVWVPKSSQPMSSVAGTTDPENFDVSDVNAEKGSANYRKNLRWVYLVFGLLACGFGISLAFSVLSPTTKAFTALFYTFYINTGLSASTYNAALAYFVVLAVHGFFSTIAVVPTFWKPVDKMLKEGVNPLHTVLDVSSSIVSYFGFLTLIYVRDGHIFGLQVLVRIALDVIAYGFFSENSEFMKKKKAGESGAGTPTYYGLIIAWIVGTVALWLSVGTFWVDACWYSVNLVLTTRETLLIITGILFAIYDLGTPAMAVIRYLRCDSGCFTLDVPYFAVIEVLRNLKLLFVGVVFAIALWGIY